MALRSLGSGHSEVGFGDSMTFCVEQNAGVSPKVGAGELLVTALFQSF